MSNENFLKKTLLALIIAFFLIELYSAFYFKQLFGDGAYWAYEIINTKNYYIAEPFLRFSTLIWQTPSVIVSLFTHNAWLSTLLFCISYAFYPFICIALSYILLKKDHLSLFFYVSTAFILSITGSLAFSVSISNEASGYFLILFSYIISNKKLNLVYTLILCLLILFSYELSIIFLLFSIALIIAEKKIDFSIISTLALTAILQIAFLFLRILPNNGHTTFKNSLISLNLDPFLALAILFGSIILLICYTKNNYFKKLMLLFFSISCLYLIQKILTKEAGSIWSDSYQNRILSIPIMITLTTILYLIYKTNRLALGKIHFFVIAASIVICILFSIRVLNFQTNKNLKISDYISKNKGCTLLTKDKESEIFGAPIHNSGWSIPMIAALYNKSIKIESIFFSGYANDLNKNKEEICKINNGVYKIESKDFIFALAVNKNLDFSTLSGSPILKLDAYK